MMGIGEWVFSPAGCCCCKPASLQSFCALCCSPYVFLSQLEERRRGPPAMKSPFLAAEAVPGLLVSSSLVGVACKWPTGRSAGRKERKPCCSAQLSLGPAQKLLRHRSALVLAFGGVMMIVRRGCWTCQTHSRKGKPGRVGQPQPQPHHRAHTVHSGLV